jgi:hypothetical protein
MERAPPQLLKKISEVCTLRSGLLFVNPADNPPPENPYQGDHHKRSDESAE